MEDKAIRRLKNEEMPENLRLSQFAFQYALTPEQVEERLRYLKAEDFLGYFINGRLAAKMAIYPMRTWLNGKSVKMGGVASVATWPEYRRQGMVGKLLRRGLEAMREDGLAVSFLHPFAVSFYRKFGWELCIEYKTYTLETAQLPVFADPGGHMETTADIALLNRIYEAYAAGFNGMLMRDEAWWRRKLFEAKPGMAAVYFTGEGEPAGYVYYQVRNYEMTIHDMAFADERARRGIWRFIANHDSMMKSVVLKAPIDDPLPFMLDDPKIKQEIVPYFMARIVDVQALLQQYTFAAGAKRLLVLEIDDAHAEWNDGVFAVRIDETGSALAERVDKGTYPREAAFGDGFRLSDEVWPSDGIEAGDGLWPSDISGAGEGPASGGGSGSRSGDGSKAGDGFGPRDETGAGEGTESGEGAEFWTEPGSAEGTGAGDAAWVGVKTHRIACGIGTLSAMLMGYMRPSRLHALGRLNGAADDVAALEAAIPMRTTYLADFF